jgi:hypothetical protein
VFYDKPVRRALQHIQHPFLHVNHLRVFVVAYVRQSHERDFISSQLTDTRYISRLAQEYLCQLGCDVNVTKGFVVSEMRHQWGVIIATPSINWGSVCLITIFLFKAQYFIHITVIKRFFKWQYMIDFTILVVIGTDHDHDGSKQLQIHTII